MSVELLGARQCNALFRIWDNALFTLIPFLEINPQLESEMRCVLSNWAREPVERVNVQDEFNENSYRLTISRAEREAIADEEDFENKNDLRHPTGMMNSAKLPRPLQSVDTTEKELQNESK